MSLAPEPNSAVPELAAIPGCPGYSASKDGRIFSHWHRVGFGPVAVDMARPPRELRQFDRRTLRGYASPYLSVNLVRNGKRCNRFVHELVLLAWVGERPGSPDEVEACHGPGGSKDNRLENLRWDTVQANAADRALHAELRKAAADYAARDVFADLDLVSDG